MQTLFISVDANDSVRNREENTEMIRYDAHCHIFTLEYALKEAKSMYHDMLAGTYPFNKPSLDSLTAHEAQAPSGQDKLSLPDWWKILQLLKQFYQLMHAAFTSEEDNLNFLQTQSQKAYSGDTPRIIPLMMDIFYLLAYPLDKDKDAVPMANARMSVSENDFQKGWNDMLDEFSKFLSGKKSTAQLRIPAEMETLVDKAIDLVEKERAKPVEKAVNEGGYSESMNFYKTDGFCFHMDNLMALVGKRPGELFPFVAIDPRRPGIIDTLCSGAFFSGNEHFYGVKLYPRMGYHPLCKPMYRVYEYCNEHKLPITFHCGKSGFPPGTDWIYSDFGNPANFEPVLQAYPDLRIDFAHMGSSDPTFEWADEVNRLVSKYDNAFTDLSCYTVADELPPMKKYWVDNMKLQDRLMFGTDFDVMYFTAEITMEKYYRNFKKEFAKKDLSRMMHDNPACFMNLH